MTVFKHPRGKRRTSLWTVLAVKNRGALGTILWRSAWRQYVFEPGDRTVFSSGCMDEIVRFLSLMNEARRKGIDEASAIQWASDERSATTHNETTTHREPLLS